MTIIEDGISLPDLVVPSTTFVADPALADAVEMEYEVVAPASPTSGPNRMTLHVPTETTVLSLGAASPRWNTDAGITGYTDHHIHFETKQNNKTVVSLGGPATTAAIEGHQGRSSPHHEEGGEGEHAEGAEHGGHEADAPEAGVPDASAGGAEDGGAHAEGAEASGHEGGEHPDGGTEAGAHEEGEHAAAGGEHAEGGEGGEGTPCAKAPTGTRGYSMVTADRAWHESNGQHYLLSLEQDISIRTMGGGKRAVVQADAGHVDLNGGEEVNLSASGVAIGAASSIHHEPVPYDGHFSGSAPSSTSAKTAKTWAGRASALASAHDIGLKFKKTWGKWDKGKLLKKPSFYVDAVKWGSDVYKFVTSLGKITPLFSHPESPADCVKVGAEKNIAGIAGADVSLVGNGASLGSLGCTTIGAGAAATLKGNVFAGVGGTFSSLKGKKRVEVASTWGDVNLSAKKNVHLSADDEVIISGEEGAQVTSKQALLLGGEKGAWIGTKKFGAIFEASGIAFGKANDSADMKAAKVEAHPAIQIENDKIAIVGAKASVTLENTSFKLKAPEVHLDAKLKKTQLEGTIIKLV